jgi:DNA topoisomerase-1
MAKAPTKSRKTPRTAPAGGAATAERPAKGGFKRGGGRGRGPSRGTGFVPGSATGKHLVIVESPSKAKTINKYLGKDYMVLASVGHVRDLPSKNPKGVKSPVPGVDLEHKFKPTYEVLSGKDNVVRDLKKAAKESLASGMDVWFATDLDREGEAIAWHLAQELGIESKQAKRVIFAAITKGEIEKAFHNPHPIDEDRVNAQQARRILDRIVGYQVSPLLWKKVARGLSAGRVQSVAVRLVVEREREIRAFVPDEYWTIAANFTPEMAKASGLAASWKKFLAERDEKGVGPNLKQQGAWLGEHGGFRAELVEVGGQKFDIGQSGSESPAKFAAENTCDLTPQVSKVLQNAGATNVQVRKPAKAEESGKGCARWPRSITADIDPATPYAVTAIETKRTTTRPSPPFITSSLQQAASSRLGFGAQRTMRAAQQLYEGVDIPGEGPVGLITYMRTDSTHLSGEALNMARDFIGRTYGPKYLPDKPNFFTSSNKDAQEAHEAIRPTSLDYPPNRVKNALSPDQLRLYTLVWERFLACQMTPAQWDATAVTITGGKDPKSPLTFRATGRILVFDGFYRVTGVPAGGEEQNLPALKERQPLVPFAIDPRQRFTAPPARYTEASLIKTLESEGIGRPSTYASIIQVIQDRAYVEQMERRFYATDLGEVVTDKLIEAFPQIMDVGYTREMEGELDKVEEEHLDWIKMLERFYGPFKDSLEIALETLGHAKAEIIPAPKEFRCAKCGSDLVYRFGKNGRFLSCSTYPECDYAAPIDREGKPRQVESVNIACPKCGGAMTRRTGRFGPFLGCARYGDKQNPCDGILNIDKKGHVTAPSQPPLITDLPCPTCGQPLNLRNGLRGPWLGCSAFPKCRGRGKWNEVPEPKRAELVQQMEAHDKANPVKVIRTRDGRPLTDAKGKPLPDAPMVDALVVGGPRQAGNMPVEEAPPELDLESVA